MCTSINSDKSVEFGDSLVLFSSLSSSGLLCMQIEKWRHKIFDPGFDPTHVKASIPGEVLSVRGAQAWGYFPNASSSAFPTEVGPGAVICNSSNVN